MLAAGAAGPVDLHLNVLLPDLHLVVILDLGHDLHRGKAGLPAGVGIKGRHPDQPVDAVLTLQKAVGVIPLDGNGRGLDARLVAVLIVQDLIGEVVALRPAGVHPVEHLGPVLGLGAAGAGMEGQDGAVAVVLPREERGHPGLLNLFFQGLETGLQLFQQLLILRLLAHLAQGRQILPLGHQLVLAGDLVLQLLEALLHLLGSLQVVPEAVLGGLVLQLSGLRAGAVHVQRGGELLQLGPQVPEPLLIFVVFDQSHVLSPLPQISLAIVLYRRNVCL